MDGQAQVTEAKPDNTLARQNFTSEYYMLKKQQEIERDELIKWGKSLEPLVHVNLIHTGVNSITIHLIDDRFRKIFKKNILNFISYLKVSNNLKIEIQKIADDYDVDVLNIAKLIVQEADYLIGSDLELAEAYYQVAALFYKEEEA